MILRRVTLIILSLILNSFREKQPRDDKIPGTSSSAGFWLYFLVQSAVENDMYIYLNLAFING